MGATGFHRSHPPNFVASWSLGRWTCWGDMLGWHAGVAWLAGWDGYCGGTLRKRGQLLRYPAHSAPTSAQARPAASPVVGASSASAQPFSQSAAQLRLSQASSAPPSQVFSQVFSPATPTAPGPADPVHRSAACAVHWANCANYASGASARPERACDECDEPIAAPRAARHRSRTRALASLAVGVAG